MHRVGGIARLVIWLLAALLPLSPVRAAERRPMRVGAWLRAALPPPSPARPAERRPMRLAVWLLAALLPLSPARAAEPDPAPLLRIETATHTAAITDIAVSADGALVATAAADKTVRVWDGATGALVRTIRPPIAPGTEGLLNALALLRSPRGDFVLTGGITGQSWGDPVLAYLFEIGTGTMRYTHKARGTITHLAPHAPGGTLQALAIGYSNAVSGLYGVEVTDSGFRRAQVVDLTAPPAALDFAADGRLAVVTAAGDIVVLPPVGGDPAAPPTRGRMPGARDLTPSALRWSPDGTRLALAYANSATIDIVDATSLKRRSRLELVAKGGRAQVTALAFVAGPGGRAALWAGGGVTDAEGRHILRRWDDVAKPKSGRDVAVARDAISALAPGPDGSVYFAAADPVWGRVDGDMTVHPGRRFPGTDHRGVHRGGFAISPDGARVGVKPAGAPDTDWAGFDMAGLALATGAPPGAGALVQAPPAALRDWENGPAPVVGSRQLALLAGEIARAAHALPDGRFVVGADYSLYLFDATGVLLARHAVESAAQALVATADGTRLVVAYRDGTIRWHSLGAEDLFAETGALFLARPDHWAAWLPDGRFAASAGGGAELVGFHVNRALAAAAEWVEIGQLYDAMYAPDALRALVGRDPGAARRLAERVAIAGAEPTAATPAPTAQALIQAVARPDVRIDALCFAAPGAGDEVCVTPDQLTRGATRVPPPAATEAAAPPAPPGPAGDAATATADAAEPAPVTARFALPAGVDTVTVRFSVWMAGAPQALTVLVNDQAVWHPTRGAIRVPTTPAADWQPFDRQVVLGPGTNQIAVRAYAEAGVYGRSDPVFVAVAAAEAEARPTLHVLAIGASAYGGELPALAAAGNDARAFADLLGQHPAASYADVAVTRLLDPDVTRPNILAALADLGRRVRRTDAVVVYLAGHGIIEAGKFHYIPTDVVLLDQIAAGALSEDDLLTALGDISAGQVMLVLDTCHSGAFPTEVGGRLNHASGYYVLAASAAVEEALDAIEVTLADGSTVSHGPVVVAAMEAAREGRAALRSGVVTAHNLGSYVQDRVAELARRNAAYSQQAQFFVRSRAAFDLATAPK